MICLNCRKQLPDDATTCSYCGKAVDHPVQLKKEISFRRYQRWIFYALIIIIFLGMIGVILKIYSTNTKILLDIANVKKELDQKESALKTANEDLVKRNELLQTVQSNLSAKDSQLQEVNTNLVQKTEDYKKVLDEKTNIEQQYKQSLEEVNKADANIYSLIIKLGLGISNPDIAKIPVADANFIGDDSDADGLSDLAEVVFGTDKNLADTDNDGYNDKEEIMTGFNPLGEGSLGIDQNFANKQKGKILLQVEQNGEAWYVNPGDGKRYYLGNPADGFRVMRDIEYWTKDFGGTGE
ncbi:MAG: zinc-ribbon domain-containing protein [Patescibacteria group bacterium]